MTAMHASFTQPFREALMRPRYICDAASSLVIILARLKQRTLHVKIDARMISDANATFYLLRRVIKFSEAGDYIYDHATHFSAR